VPDNRVGEMTRYLSFAVKGPGMIRVYRDKGAPQPWTRVTVRNNTSCACCTRPIKSGNQAYRPHTNQDNRADRICVNCIDKEDINGLGNQATGGDGRTLQE
jgi:hypothetical protein